MNNKIAILYICTGKYDVFWKDFYESYEAKFLPNSEKHYFVFTDKDILYKDNANVTVTYQESLGWPGNTLMRFHIFKKVYEELKQYDYIFFMNANCECVSEITEEEFLNPEGLTVVKHPGFFNKSNKEFTYDRNPKSTAYVPEGQGEYYVCGGINGGTSKRFLKLIDDLSERIDKDNSNDIIALWHDESQINRYIIDTDQSEYKVMSPSYCYPEGWDIPFDPKIVVREKSKWIDVEAVKDTSSGLRKVYRKIKRKLGAK